MSMFLVGYGGLATLIYRSEKRKNDEIVLSEVDIEKKVVEKNDLELSYKKKGESISIFFEKYSAYYNLRRLADEFSSTLDISKLADLIVTRTLEFIQKGDWCLLSLAQQEKEKDELGLIASKSTGSAKKSTRKLGDFLDFWVLRNRQHLLVSDTEKDFRFDLRREPSLSEIRSAILSPLAHEGKIVGTLRVDSVHPETFNTDQLRLLDAISTLASSALSNATLYQKTVELAIRDSLTRLYVQRYFLERLREEHKRALLTHEPLSLLMCDLDHFKKINDCYGHSTGDLVLIRFAELMSGAFAHGILARYGGEEFTVLLPGVVKREALLAADKLREQLMAEQIDVRRETIRVTVSIGVANIPHDTLDPEELIRIADERLYQAKKFGRNQVC